MHLSVNLQAFSTKLLHLRKERGISGPNMARKINRKTYRILYTVSYPELYFIFPKFHLAHSDSLGSIYLDGGKENRNRKFTRRKFFESMSLPRRKLFSRLIIYNSKSEGCSSSYVLYYWSKTQKKTTHVPMLYPSWVRNGAPA